ncbi:DUF397 domain-containing protein [Streptomyces sp. 7-21]|jgi:hypothetical protein|uniref:DUF397 domain-containing protein n=1 Tax=Streptomyces sp. 7-21 TaxID=2802283 RepID=UPI00191E08A7|nr:DUF397 domain-containing protein [Streptomyces sp. 7-21]MBL1065546.1 DUF397 domain-containing protein [Streptomyces sp. 7-21]
MSTGFGLSHAVWAKSSYSNGNGEQCVEFARNIPGVVPVRDSKNPQRALAVSAGAWQAFVDYLKG